MPRALVTCVTQGLTTTIRTSIQPTMKPNARRRKPHRVLVIGSGMSGLACARELRQRGYEVLVVEARSRVGGRLKGGKLRVRAASEPQVLKEHPVDLGGALIHGIDENPLYVLAQELGIATRSVQECLLMDDSGWPVDPKQDEKAQHSFNECLDESFRRIQKAKMEKGTVSSATTIEPTLEKTNNSDTPSARASTRSSILNSETSSFGDLFQIVCAEKKADALPALLQWHQANLEVSCGASFDRLGWDWNEDEPYGFDGEHHALKDSWTSVTERLAENLDILFESSVTHIQVVHPDPVELAKHQKKLEREEMKRQQSSHPSASSSKPVNNYNKIPDVLLTRASRRIRGEDVDVRRSGRQVRKSVDRFVVDHSIPQSLSKQSTQNRKRTHSSSGQPPFRSESYVQVTVKQSSGHTIVLEADAVVCTLPLGILKQDPSEGGVSFDPPLPKEKQIAIERLGTGLLNKCALSFDHIFWQNVDFIGWAESEHSSYLVLNGAAYTGGKPILIFMYGGNFAKDIQDWTDQQIVEDCMIVLQKLCGRRKLPRPLDYCVTRWGKDPQSRMAFTYVPPGVDGFSELRNMSQPIYGRNETFGNVPVLMFAGEHTTPFHPSTIHGAFLSGIREAYRLDSIVCADALENFKFSEDDLYQHTFVIGKQAKENGLNEDQDDHKQDSDSKPGRNRALSTASMTTRENVTSGSFHRRRGASGVMRLSRQTAGSSTIDTNDSYTEIAKVKAIITSPKTDEKERPLSRRLRATVGQSLPHNSNLESKHANGNTDPTGIKELEDRMLLRSLESYGADYECIQEFTLPVYGAENDRRSNLTQIQSRCHRLVKSSQLKPPSRPRNSFLKSWIAKHVVNPMGKSSASTKKKR